MKKLPIFLALIAVAIVAYSMTQLNQTKSLVASNNTTTETRNVADFTKIEVEGVFQVDVTYSNDESVSVEAPDNLHEYIDLKVKSGTLKIAFSKKTSVTSNCSIKIHITTSKLNEFKLSGASSIALNNSLVDDTFKVESEGAASFQGEIEVNEATIELDGAASANVYGSASIAHLKLSGASQLNDYDFNVKNLNVDLYGASSVTITSTRSLKGKLSGASSLKYKGNPNIKRLSTSGASNAEAH